ncbi:HAD-IIA family hydrolase [Kamptonema cortianum]|nr:HAD-IIA family hydrolase [Geitlerinema splendidum]MDK3156137.1 HAD-IIA family hydrolase [Kamptonema cortianum]
MRLYEAYLLDLDGTVYRGDEPCEGAAEAINWLLKRGSQIRYLTNNSTVSPDEVAERLKSMAIPCDPKWVLTSALATTALCKSKGHSSVAVLGETALITQLEAAGIHAIPVTSSSQATALVAGLCRSLDYDLLSTAMSRILDGADFIATNRDLRFPLPSGALKPGSGAIIAALEACTGRTPLVAGKPEPLMAQMAMESAGSVPESTLIVGDSLATDIACGQAAGCDTYLVLSGVTSSIPAGQSGGENLMELRQQTTV